MNNPMAGNLWSKGIHLAGSSNCLKAVHVQLFCQNFIGGYFSSRYFLEEGIDTVLEGSGHEVEREEYTPYIFLDYYVIDCSCSGERACPYMLTSSRAPL